MRSQLTQFAPGAAHGRQPEAVLVIAEVHLQKSSRRYNVSRVIRANAARAVALLPPLNVHEHIDLSIALWRQGRVAYLDERAKVLYAGSPPLPLRDFECPYFRFRWDPTRARQSDRYVRDKWHIADLFDVMPFVARQHLALRPESVLTRYDSAFEADSWPEEIAAA